MARTARTRERAAASNSSPQESSSDSDIFEDEKGNNSEHQVSKNSKNCSSVVAAGEARAATATKSVTTAAAAAATVAVSSAQNASYARASSTVARMPSRGREDGPPANYPAQRHEMSHAPSYQRPQPSWNRSRGRNSGGSHHRHFGRGGHQYHHRSRSPPGWESQQHRHHDRPFEQGDRRGWEYEHSRYQDDGQWGRGRAWDNPPYHDSSHQPYPSYDHQPRERYSHGGQCSGRYEPRNNYRSEHKRPRYNDSNIRDSNHNRQRQGPRNWIPPSPQRQHQPRRDNQEVCALKNDVAKLKRDFEELKKTNTQSTSRPMIANNVEGQSAGGGFIQNQVDSSSVPQKTRADHSRVTNATYPSINETTQSTTGGAIQSTELAGTKSETQAHIDGKLKDSGPTEGFVSNVMQQEHTTGPDDVAHSTIETSNDQNESSCYGESTDDENNFPTPDRQDEEIEDEADRNAPHESEEKSSDQATGSSTSEHQSTADQAHNNSTDSDQSDEDSVDLVVREDYDSTGEIAFCCQNCRCWETAESKFFKYSQIRNNCGNSGGGEGGGNTKLYHKACCHGDTKRHDDYLSPMARAMDESFDGKKKKKKSASRLDTYDNIKKTFNTAKREETRFENEEVVEAKDCSNYSNEAYNDCCRIFQQRDKERRAPLRVLDLFSGIGSGTVVLKRLGLPVQTIVHVEHDPVANIVSKFNHENDGITHNYVETFEHIYGIDDEPDDKLVEALIERHGPFDLVLSGAPCQSYSGLNATRDRTSDNALYLCKVGRLIQKMDEIQIGLDGTTDKILFLSENVVFKDHDEIDKCYTDQEGGLTPICLDAKDFGPCKRNRFYWMNMPVKSTEHIKLVASAVSIDGLLDEGFGAVARLLLSDEDLVSMPVKANAFLASMSRIDDRRMIRYKLEASSSSNKNARYHIETYSVGERERMMGLPTGYVETPICKLFSELTEKAFLLPETTEGKTYRDFLGKDFWLLRKKCQFKFRPSSDPPYFQLALSSPQEGKLRPDFYMEEQYCKHLIGNGWSIPVIEHLLASLRDLFADDVLRSYDKYTYRHPWEPYSSM